jgi:hypothetical protein
MHIIAQVIQSQQLGGYTARTFPAAIDGHRVHQVAFTKFFLGTAGICSVPLLFDNARINKLAHTAHWHCIRC